MCLQDLRLQLGAWYRGTGHASAGLSDDDNLLVDSADGGDVQLASEVECLDLIGEHGRLVARCQESSLTTLRRISPIYPRLRQEQSLVLSVAALTKHDRVGQHIQLASAVLTCYLRSKGRTAHVATAHQFMSQHYN